jgi:hypothetical protein
MVFGFNKSKKFTRTKDIHDDLIPIGSWTKNIDQPARDPKQEIGRPSLKENEGTPTVVDEFVLLEQFINNAFRKTARDEPIFELLRRRQACRSGACASAKVSDDNFEECCAP